MPPKRTFPYIKIDVNTKNRKKMVTFDPISTQLIFCIVV